MNPLKLPNASDLEATLDFYLRAADAPSFQRELRFCPPRRFRFDFAWPEQRLAVEVDGGTWTGGRHVRGTGFEADCEKSALAAIHGWRVIHLTRSHVESGVAVGWVLAALRGAP